MKTSILSALIAAALALSATAQDFNRITFGMTFDEVAAILGQPIDHVVSSWYYKNDHPYSVSDEGARVYLPYSYEIIFDSNGRVETFTQFSN